MSAIIEQLPLFPETMEERLERQIEEMKAQSDKVRKSQFAKISYLLKTLEETRHDLDTLKQALCRSKDNEYANLPLFSLK